VRWRSFGAFSSNHFSATSATVVLDGATRSPRATAAIFAARCLRASSSLEDAALDALVTLRLGDLLRHGT
jgi:hypothetical protein